MNGKPCGFLSPQSKQLYVMKHNPCIFFALLSVRRNKEKEESIFFVATGHSEVHAARSFASSSPVKQQMSQNLLLSLWNANLQKYMLRSTLTRGKYSPFGIAMLVIFGIQSSKIFSCLLVQHLCHRHAK